MAIFHNAIYLAGRILLALYFIVPGIIKAADMEGTAVYMNSHQVPFVMPLLILTILLQIGGGICLLIGFRTQLTAFLLAGLVLVISYYMHNFWAMDAGLQMNHERQNFVKNMAIMAGLMILAGTPSRLSVRWPRR